MFYGAVYKYYSFIDVDICVHVWVQQYKLLYNQRHLWLATAKVASDPEHHQISLPLTHYQHFVNMSS